MRSFPRPHWPGEGLAGASQIEQIIQFLPDATFVVNTQGRVVAWNRAMEEMTAVPASQIIGRGNYEHSLIFYGLRRPALIDLVLRFDPEAASLYLNLTRKKDTLTAESYATHLPNGPAFISAKASPLQTPQGKIKGAIESVRDITEQKRLFGLLRASEIRFRELFEHSPVAYHSLDEKGRLIDFNPGFVQLLGYQPAELIGRSFASLWTEPASQSFPAIFSQLLAAGQSSHQIELVRKDGTLLEVLVESRVQRDPHGRFVRTHCVTHDITRHKRNEKQIIRLNNMYAALAETNDILATCEDEDMLFAQICRVVVDYGKITMSWIGRLDEDGWIEPVARAGWGVEYLNGIRLSGRTDLPDGHGPSGEVMRSGKPLIIEDFSAEPRLAPWYERARPFGWKTCAAFPVPRGGVPYGVLVVYTTEDDILDQRVLDLLARLASNLARTLDRLDQAAENRRFVAALAESESFNRGLVESTHEGVCVWDGNERIIFVNQRAAEIFGYSIEEAPTAMGQRLAIFLTREQQVDGTDRFENYLTGSGRHFEVRGQCKDGREIWLLASTTPRLGPDGRYGGGFAMFTDITERKAAEKRIRHLAHYDPLTGLPNRLLLTEKFNAALVDARRLNSACALVFLDLDHFKHINDTLGHLIGDRLLVEVTGRLKSILRPQYTLFRFGGDEFVLVLPGTGAEETVSIAREILRAVAEPLEVEQYRLTTTLSIGIAMYPSDGEDVETLSRCADIALHEAKKSGRNCWRLFTPAMQQRTRRHIELTAALHKALDNNEFTLHYQPQVSLPDQALTGVEALLRWQTPDWGLVSPKEFIPLAEETGLILSIGEWVLRTALRQASTWRARGLPPVRVAVNVSPIQIHQTNLPKLVEGILAETGLPGDCLELELTESVAMGDPVQTATMMESLGTLGVSFAIDDFGTGYSSLAYLKRFRCHRLKIDQSFVKGIGTSTEDEALIQATVNLAHSLRLATLAEGVETERQLTFLINNGCDEAQGFFFSRPQPIADIQDWMTKVSRPPTFRAP